MESMPAQTLVHLSNVLILSRILCPKRLIAHRSRRHRNQSPHQQ
ncbi:hypothetical protein FOZG_18535 [Fusarium oxysporum Fo47]|uniref:Uncharacterized protein n=1 Tax=Fusarium oxysporum Fo47 TaxID=660027 RepID=W9JDM0_FUSOX|nr:hypothetical protein FOZG_18535 [Fusarium oxysporum Fo47]